MNFISLCSGIEAASVAFGPLGWKAIAFSEIEGFPSAVLAHHYPTVRNYGDMSLFRDWPDELFADADAIVGGPPCQAFSVAGARRGLLDARGNLTLIYVELLDHADDIRRKYGKPPIVALYENVPGIFSDRTNAFGHLVGGLAGEDVPVVPPGKRWTDAGCVFGPERAVAWRLFDAQFFALAQRRRRVFVVASARPGFDPATVLFEWDGLRRDTAPSREAGQEAAATLDARAQGGGFPGTGGACGGHVQPVIAMAHGQGGAEVRDDGGAPCLTCNHEAPIAAYPATTHTLRGEGFDASEDGTGRGTPLVPVGVDYTNGLIQGDISGTLEAAQCKGNRGQGVIVGLSAAVATAIRTANTSANGHGISPELAHTLDRAQGQCVAFDTTQITSPANVSNPKPGDPCHPLAAGAHAPAIAFDSRQDPVSSEEVFGALGCASPQAQAVAYAIQAGALRVNPASGPDGLGVQPEHAYTLEARAEVQAVATSTKVRRLTPEECEALQGFPRGYTAIPWRKKPASECPDGPRYRALGNSWAVPCARWIGSRIAQALDPSLRASTNHPSPPSEGFFIQGADHADE